MFYFDIAKHHLLAIVGATFPKCRVGVGLGFAHMMI